MYSQSCPGELRAHPAYPKRRCSSNILGTYKPIQSKVLCFYLQFIVSWGSGGEADKDKKHDAYRCQHIFEDKIISQGISSSETLFSSTALSAGNDGVS